jgi:hypothetical protein
MPHQELKKAISSAVSKHRLDDSATTRIIAWLEQAEAGDFAARDQEEQLQKILSVLPGYQNAPEGDPKS